jgi:hypothetical protein
MQFIIKMKFLIKRGLNSKFAGDKTIKLGRIAIRQGK